MSDLLPADDQAYPRVYDWSEPVAPPYDPGDAYAVSYATWTLSILAKFYRTWNRINESFPDIHTIADQQVEEHWPKMKLRWHFFEEQTRRHFLKFVLVAGENRTPRLLSVRTRENEPDTADDSPRQLRDDVHSTIRVLQEIERISGHHLDLLKKGIWLDEQYVPGMEVLPEDVFFVVCFGWNPGCIKNAYRYLIEVPFRRLARLNLRGSPAQPSPRWFDDPPGPGFGFEANEADVHLQAIREFLDQHLEREAGASAAARNETPATRNSDAEARGGASGKRAGMSVEQANKIAMGLAENEGKRFFELSERKQAERIGCSWQTWQRTPLYQTAKAKRPARKPSSPKTVSLTPKLEAVTGQDDKGLQRLIAEQQADKEPSPLDADSPGRPRVIHSHKRL